MPARCPTHPTSAGWPTPTTTTSSSTGELPGCPPFLIRPGLCLFVFCVYPSRLRWRPPSRRRPAALLLGLGSVWRHPPSACKRRQAPTVLLPRARSRPRRWKIKAYLLSVAPYEQVRCTQQSSPSSAAWPGRRRTAALALTATRPQPDAATALLPLLSCRRRSGWTATRCRSTIRSCSSTRRSSRSMAGEA